MRKTPGLKSKLVDRPPWTVPTPTYAVAPEAGAESTMVENRFGPARFKDGYGPVGAWFLLFRVKALNANGGDDYQTKNAHLPKEHNYTGGAPSARSFQLYFPASHDLDGFRKFTRSLGVMEMFDLSRKERGALDGDDEALLAFAMPFLKHALFGEQTMPKDPRRTSAAAKPGAKQFSASTRRTRSSTGCTIGAQCPMRVSSSATGTWAIFSASGPADGC